MSIASASFELRTANGASVPKPLGIVPTAIEIVRTEGGLTGLYRGLVPTAVGVAPYVGLNFSTYELLRGYVTPPGKETAVRKLTCGALAGTISQTITYPFDVLRRKMQTVGMKGESVVGPRFLRSSMLRQVVLWDISTQGQSTL